MRSEIERLVEALENSNELRAEAKELGTDPKALVEWAQNEGYGFSLEEWCSHAKDRLGELSDEELEAVAGGVRGQTTAIGGPRFLHASRRSSNEANKEEAARFTVELYVETMKFDYHASDA
jgi:predicted ribosomally synthesized peptide with nif11-like leader